MEPIEKRVAILLLNQASEDSIEVVGPALKPIYMTKSLIANIVGTTTETAIRILSRWKKAGLIQSERGKIMIVDAEAVCEIAEAPYVTEDDQKINV
jgi:CRP/FNR family transcriptional regulator